MKIVAIGDIHGRSHWKRIIESETFDKLIFIGDYLDSFDISGESQLGNFQEIIEYKKENSDKVILLIGNHEYHYISDSNYSGFQYSYSFLFKDILKSLIKDRLIQMSYIYKDFLFSHAGVTKTWLENNHFNGNIENIKDISNHINDLFEFKPNTFDIIDNKPKFNQYGDNIYQSPIWIRPKSLLSDRVNFKQIVGHTSNDKIIIEEDIAFIDALKNEQYLVIENDKFKIKKIKK